MYLQLELLSDTCIGSGESLAGIIDTEVEFDKQGIPYIPAKRIKGVLREAAEDISLICENKYDSLIKSIFGEAGQNHIPNLIIDNGFISNYEDIKVLIDKIEKNKDYKAIVSLEKIKDLYTYIRTQTAIDKETGVSKKSSLRKIRVLNKGLTFKFNINDITKEEEQFLTKCCKMVRHIGLNRTRGFGNVKLELKNGNVYKEKIVSMPKKIKNKVKYTITLTSPCVIDECYIKGGNILGIMASRYLKFNNLNKDGAQNNEEFKNLFLSDKVIFSNGYPSVNNKLTYPTPITFLKKKGSKSNEVFDLCNEEQNEDIMTSKIQYVSLGYDYGYIEDSEKFKAINCLNEISYHHRRPDDKTIGRAIEGKGQYFNYISVEKGTKFTGEISGDKIYIERLLKLFSKDNRITIGASRSAQYGQAVINFFDADNNEMDDLGDRAAILLTSPMIIKNEFGLNSTKKQDLINTLGLEKIAEAVYIKKTEVGGFNTKWGMPKERVVAIKEGSVILVNTDDIDDIDDLINKSYGERVNEGFGKITLINYNLEDELIVEVENENKKITSITADEIIEDKQQYKKFIKPLLMKAFYNRVCKIMNLNKNHELYELKKLLKDKNTSKVVTSNLLLYLKTSKSFEEFGAQLDKAADRSKTNNIYSKVKEILIKESLEKKFDEIIKNDFINNQDKDNISKIFKTSLGKGFFEKMQGNKFDLYKIYLEEFLTNIKYERRGESNE